VCTPARFVTLCFTAAPTGKAAAPRVGYGHDEKQTQNSRRG
jgi:hypothetical protein